MSSRGRGIAFDAEEAAARALGIRPADLPRPAGAEAARALLARLEPAEAAALATLVDMGGAAPALLLVDELAAELELEPAAGAKAGDPASARRLAERALLALWESGLVARDRASRQFFLVPDAAAALVPALRERMLASLPVVQPPQPALDEHVLVAALNVLRHEPLRLTREDAPYKRGLESLAERLKAALPRKAPVETVETLVAALEDAGLLERRGEALEVRLDEAEAWARSSAWRRATRVFGADPSGRAAHAHAFISGLAPDRAWPARRLLALLRRQVLAALDPDAADRPAASDLDAVFAAALARLERAGLIARVSGDPGTLALTATGRSAATSAPLPEAGFHVGADLAVLVPRAVDLPTHLELGALARLEAADVVARYRLDQHLVLDALDRGASPAAIEALLQRATPALPVSVRDDVRRWCARFGEVTSHQGILVTCEPADRHAEFAAVVTRSGLCATMLGPGLALVEPRDHAALGLALSASGFTPRKTILTPRGPLRPRLPPPRAGAVAGALAAEPAAASPLQAPASLPEPLTMTWGARVDRGAGLAAAPPPGAFVARLKEKYRREFGGAQLAALDQLELDELLALEERGGIRQFLAGKGSGAPASAPRLEEYQRDEMVSVSPVRARQVLEQVMAAGLRCQVGHAPRPGQSTRLLITPLELVTDTTGTWLRARLAGGRERMLALERIHSLRIVTS